jgi:hypothetical protein
MTLLDFLNDWATRDKADELILGWKLPWVKRKQVNPDRCIRKNQRRLAARRAEWAVLSSRI